MKKADFRFRGFKQITNYLLSVTLLFGIGLLAYNHLVPTVVAGGAGMIYRFRSLADLEEKADLIVLVTVTGSGREEWDDPCPSGGTFGNVNTFTPVRVDKVFKGNVNPGDTIEVAEHIWSQRTPYRLEIYTIHPYMPLQRNLSYLLFLKENHIPGNPTIFLRPCGEFQGKFVWPLSTTITTKKLEVMAIDDDFRDLYLQVLHKYRGTD